jgi:hypothetical protein
MALPAFGTALALPHVGQSLDFAHNGFVAAHIRDRSLTPFPVIQNASGAWPLLLAYLASFAAACAAYLNVLRLPNLRESLVWFAFTLSIPLMLVVPFFPTSDPYAYALYALEAGPLHLDPYVSQTVAAAHSAWAGPLFAISLTLRRTYGTLTTGLSGLPSTDCLRSPLHARMSSTFLSPNAY